MLDTAAAWLDERLVRSRLRRGGADFRGRVEAIAPHMADDRLLDWPSGGMLVRGGPIAPIATRRRSGVTDLSWPSRYVAWSEDTGPHSAAGPNATAWARVHRTGRRPAAGVVVAIHGYGGGRRGAQRLMWPIRAWNELGLDVVLPALPFHGPRATPGRRRPPLPVDDPHLAQEGFRQAVWDLTSLLGWLREQGHGPIGIVGKSLGGYTAALLATVEADLAFLALVVPLASIADFARAHDRLGEGSDADALHAALEAVHRPTSPLSRPPRLPPERVRIVAVRGDRVTGVAQAERLARHFGVAPVVGPGGHLLQVGVDWPGTVAFTHRWCR
jgi:hypothetical protein